jgi:zinc protease
MKVILHEDHSDPLVHADVTYHVGSGREEPGDTMNGTTNTDRTNYYQTVPANQLEKVLWLEA